MQGNEAARTVKWGGANEQYLPLNEEACTRAEIAKNDAIAPRPHSARRRKGFTLVEVIVVIVIIAILASIGVPALTGYIDKARDKQYIADARDHFVAFRTVFDEAYADGEFNRAYEQSGFDVWLREGSYGKMPYISVYSLTGFAATLIGDRGDGSEGGRNLMERYYDRISDLIGEDRMINFNPYEGTGPRNAGYWEISLVGSSDSNAFSADGFIYELLVYADEDFNESWIVVTYKVDIPGLDTECMMYEYGNAVADGLIEYNPDTGYKVYHCA